MCSLWTPWGEWRKIERSLRCGRHRRHLTAYGFVRSLHSILARKRFGRLSRTAINSPILSWYHARNATLANIIRLIGKLFYLVSGSENFVQHAETAVQKMKHNMCTPTPIIHFISFFEWTNRTTEGIEIKSVRNAMNAFCALLSTNFPSKEMLFYFAKMIICWLNVFAVDVAWTTLSHFNWLSQPNALLVAQQICWKILNV